MPLDILKQLGGEVDEYHTCLSHMPNSKRVSVALEAKHEGEGGQILD